MIERKARAYIHTHGHFALVMAWKNAEAAKNEADEKFWLDVCHKIDTIQEGG